MLFERGGGGHSWCSSIYQVAPAAPAWGPDSASGATCCRVARAPPLRRLNLLDNANQARPMMLLIISFRLENKRRFMQEIWFRLT